MLVVVAAQIGVSRVTEPQTNGVAEFAVVVAAVEVELVGQQNDDFVAVAMRIGCLKSERNAVAAVDAEWVDHSMAMRTVVDSWEQLLVAVEVALVATGVAAKLVALHAVIVDWQTLAASTVAVVSE